VQPPLPGQHQPAQHPARGIEVAGHDDGGDEQVAALLGFVDEDMGTHARQARVGFGSPARCTAR
jgi:hypothetical protein